MNLKTITIALYSLYLTNIFGLKLKAAKSNTERKKLRCEYANILLSRLNIEVVVSGLNHVDPEKQYLLLSNHRSIIDPCVIELALQNTNLYGLWIAKKELYFSFFFGLFVRNGGAILLDRESKNMSQFFSAVKEGVGKGASIFVFPEGTRNKQETDIIEFKEGSRIIAVKNRLPVLPVFIKTNTNEVLHTAINKREKGLCIEVVIGEVIDIRDKSRSLEESYRERFFAKN